MDLPPRARDHVPGPSPPGPTPRIGQPGHPGISTGRPRPAWPGRPTPRIGEPGHPGIPGPDRPRRGPAETLGTGCAQNHRVGQVVAFDAEVRDVERFVVVPVVALQAAMAAAPGTDFRSGDQPESLPQRRGVPRRSGTDPPRL